MVFCCGRGRSSLISLLLVVGALLLALFELALANWMMSLMLITYYREYHDYLPDHFTRRLIEVQIGQLARWFGCSHSDTYYSMIWWR